MNNYKNNFMIDFGKEVAASSFGQPVEHKDLSRPRGLSATWLFAWCMRIGLRMVARLLSQVVTLAGSMIGRTGVMSGGMTHDVEARARRWDEKGLQALKKASCHSHGCLATASVAASEVWVHHSRYGPVLF